jgi:hypothetical protein
VIEPGPRSDDQGRLQGTRVSHDWLIRGIKPSFHIFVYRNSRNPKYTPLSFEILKIHLKTLEFISTIRMTINFTTSTLHSRQESLLSS